MGKETHIKSSDPSESKSLEEIGPNEEPLKALDERDMLEPLNEDRDEADDQQQADEGQPPPGSAGNDDENDFVALDDDEVDDEIDDGAQNEQTPASGEEKHDAVEKVQPEKNSAEDKQPDDIDAVDKKEVASKSIKQSPKKEKIAKGAFAYKKKIASVLIVLMISGFIIYSNSSIVGLKEKVSSAPPVENETKTPEKQEQIQVPQAKPPGKHDVYLAKLEEADRFREQLLAKKEEIYELKLHYRNGIAEIEDQIEREIQKSGISSFAQALENKHIELNLRTIQRRRVYIKELEKPNRWVHSGSEELLFLKRKAQLDLQMVDIAGGIDLNRHMQYINAAIQKYQPSAEKLAVAPPPADLRPLETIWNEIYNQQMNKVTTALGHKDGQIIEEICSGNFKRLTELSVITTMAARCLSKNNGSDLFLNGLTQLSPDEAKYLFQWQGSWICLNSVKKLAPAAAKYLFEWKGSWISLNGLTEFPPELALYLMEWKGSQLELMGLKYDKKKPDPRALKYLALWETMGGKLFVSESIRKEMKRVM